MPTVAQTKTFLSSRTGRLALTYLAIIMVMTIIFSLIIYAITASQFDRPLPPGQDFFNDNLARVQIQQLFAERADQARMAIILWLSLLNFATLVGGAIFSYFLARKTLEPIEQAMKAQSQFVSDASHELRTPLTALQTTNEVALRKKKLTMADAKELIGHNISETVKLRELSDALLGLVKQENADTSKVEMNIQQVVGDVLQTLVPNAQAKNIAIQDNVAPSNIKANRAALQQVIKIFLDNAVAYSPNNATISIASHESAEHITIDVTDEGIGIDESDHEKIFHRFYRVDQSRTKMNSDSSGLGLAIAKTICERQNFDITTESAIGSGSTFSVSVPKRP